MKPTEGEVASQLVHQHIVQTFEHGVTTDGEQYLVMELVEGIGLAYLVDVQNEVMQTHRLRIMVELGEAHRVPPQGKLDPPRHLSRATS